MKRLHLSPTFSLPAEAVTQTFGILAVRGAGKSNAAVVMAEEMFKAGAHWVAIDPKGDWWGVRSNKEGTGPGLPVVIFGVKKADVPLEPTSGKLIADVIIDQAMTCVLDVSEFTEGEKVRFLNDFAEHLFRRKSSEQPPTHLFLEEADDYIPQSTKGRGGDRGNLMAHLVYVFERLVKQGRARGLGATIALRTTSPQDRRAIEGWVSYHGVRDDIIDTLPTLRNGEAWVWSPSWLQNVERIQFRQRETFDSGATPKMGQVRKAPVTIADVDLDALRVRMAETIERAKAEDPRQLRKRIAELERQVKNAPAAAPPDPERESRIRKEAAGAVHRTYLPIISRILDLADKFASEIKVLESAETFQSAITEIKAPLPPVKPAAIHQRLAVVRAPAGGSGIENGLRRMLIALTQKPTLSDKQVGVRSGMSSKSGTFSTYLGKARTNGWVEGPRSRLTITPAGIASLGDYVALPAGRALLDYWLDELGGGAARMLQELAAVYPQTLAAAELGERAGLSAASGTFSTYLGKLRSLELVDGRRDSLRAAEDLFA
jgi:hypothetical protein